MKLDPVGFPLACLVIGILLAPPAEGPAQASDRASPAGSVPAGAAQEPGAPSPPEPGAAHRFSRRSDPVILKGKQAPRLLGATERLLRVFANRSGALGPIPFQMDERNDDGDFVVTRGKRAKPEEDKGAYDENDEIVFLSRDLGARTPREGWPRGARQGYEIEVTDPLDSSKAYAYVFAYDQPAAAPAPSREDYIRYEEKSEGLTHALTYEFGFLKTTSGLDFDHIAVTPAAGGKGVDVFDRLKVRVLMSIRRFLVLGLSPRLDRTEENFLVKLRGYKDGPVRVIRVMQMHLRLIGRLPAPGVTVNSVFYPDWIEWPVPVVLPFKPSWAAYNIELDVGDDFAFKPGDGVRYYSSRERRWWPVDGKMTEGEQAINRKEIDRQYHGFDGTAGGHGAGFFTMRKPESFPATLIGLYRDDSESGSEPEYYEGDENPERPEWIKGAGPLLGHRFVDWQGVGKGTHTLVFYHFYPARYEPGDEKPYLDMIDHPITIAIR